MSTMAMASLQRGLVGSLQLLSSSKDGEVFGSRSELNRACMLTSKLGSCGLSRHFGVSRPRAQEDDFPPSAPSVPSEPSRNDGNAGERYSSTTTRDIWRKGDSPLQPIKASKVSSLGRGSRTTNSSRTSTSREPLSLFAEDGTMNKAPWEEGYTGRRGPIGMRVRERGGRNPIIERLKKMQAEIAKDEADAKLALELAAKNAVNSEGDGLGPNSEGGDLVLNSDVGLRDFDNEALLAASRVDSALAPIVAGNESLFAGSVLDSAIAPIVAGNEALFAGSVVDSAVAPIVEGIGGLPETSGREIQNA